MEKCWIVTCTFCGINLGKALGNNGVEAISTIRQNLNTHSGHILGAFETIPTHGVEKTGWVIYRHISNPPKRHDK